MCPRDAQTEALLSRADQYTLRSHSCTGVLTSQSLFGARHRAVSGRPTRGCKTPAEGFSRTILSRGRHDARVFVNDAETSLQGGSCRVADWPTCCVTHLSSVTTVGSSHLTTACVGADASWRKHAGVCRGTTELHFWDHSSAVVPEARARL